MFIREQLQQAIKNKYFKEYSEHPVTLIHYHKGFYEVCKDNGDIQGTDLLNDIMNPNERPRSTLGKELHSLRLGYSVRVRKCLSNHLPVLEVVDVLNKEPQNSYLVGGGVRDSILTANPDAVKDWDFATSIPYDRLEVMFKEAGYKVQEEGKEFLVMIVSKDGNQFEIANFRKDGTYTDGRRPDSVDLGTMQEDAERRDFTCNALYYNVREVELIDPTAQGILDIQSKTLRFVGNPKDRLEEDALRGWRFMRFIKKLGFTPDKKSLKAVKSDFKNIYERSNPQRVLQELSKFINL